MTGVAEPGSAGPRRPGHGHERALRRAVAAGQARERLVIGAAVMDWQALGGCARPLSRTDRASPWRMSPAVLDRGRRGRAGHSSQRGDRRHGPHRRGCRHSGPFVVAAPAR